jgi:dehydrogenase/reductase SDR family protein 7B
MRPMRDQNVWITGASSGIGEALALEMVKRGARVIVSARRADRLEALKARSGAPERVAVHAMDVAETDRAEQNVAAARAKFGPIDVLVHNAGIGQRSFLEETGLAIDRRIMEVNYFGVVALTKAALPEMLERKSGSFAVVTSVAGYCGVPYRSAYCASKHALHGFFEALRSEVALRGVSITMLCPGFIDTDIAASALTGDGASHGKKAGVGISAERCARQIARAIDKRSPEAWPGGPEVAMIAVRRVAPGILRFVLPRVRTT